MSIRSRAPSLGPLAGALLLGLSLCLALASCEPIAIKDFIEDSLEEFQAPKSLSWTIRYPSGSTSTYQNFAVSKDGSTIILSNDAIDGHPFLSRDRGKTWSSASGLSQSFDLFALSSDGDILYAATSGAEIYRSADGGSAWSSVHASAAWTTIVCSADGKRVAAVDGSTSVLISKDGGSRWSSTATGSPGSVSYLAASADLSAILASDGGNVYLSTDGGSSFKLCAISVEGCHMLGVSGDGQTLVALLDAVSTHYLSRDGGGTWGKFTCSSGSSNSMGPVAISTFGQRVAYCESSGDSLILFASYDGGKSWDRLPGPSVSISRAVAMNANGSALFFLDPYNGIYVGE